MNKKNLTNISKSIPAVILAAGVGKRLQPYTLDIPKPLLRLDGRPILEYTLINLIQAGIRHFILVVGYKSKMIMDWIQDDFCSKLYTTFEKQFGVDLGAIAFSFILQKDFNGTGGALLLAEKHIIQNGYKYFLVTYGDIIISKNAYKRLIQNYEQNDSDLYLVGNPTKDPSTGAAIYHQNGRVINLIEKPDKSAPKTDLNNSGTYIFHKNIFSLLKEAKPSIRGEIELTTPIIDMINSNKIIKLIKVKENEVWCDVGTTQIYEQLNNDLTWKSKIF